MQTSAKLFSFGAVLIAMAAGVPSLLADGPVVPPPNAATAVGISSRDGISLSGTDLLLTRNGVTEKISKEITLSNGVHVAPDGTVTGLDGTKIMLRPDQVLSLDGKLRNAPVVEAVPPGATGVPNR